MKFLRKKKRLKVSVFLALLILAMMLVFSPLILIMKRCIFNTTTASDFQEQSRYVDLPYNRSECSLVKDMAKCRGMNLTDIPQNLPIKITELDLSNNSLENIDWSLLHRYKKTSILVMKSCNINTIPEGAFQKLQQLRHVDLSYNKLSHLNNQIFKNNTKLSEVLLNGNYLNLDSASPFLISYSITRLELRDCGIRQISNGTFSEIKILECLDVSRNKVNVLDSRSFHYNVFRELLIDPVEEISTELGKVCRNSTSVHYVIEDVIENWCETRKSIEIETTSTCMYQIAISALVLAAIVMLVVGYVLYIKTLSSRHRKDDREKSPQNVLIPLKSIGDDY